MKTKVTITVWNGGKFGEDPLCECGNTTRLEGFYPCLIDGTEITPDDERWQNDLYVCARCNLFGIVTKETR